MRDFGNETQGRATADIALSTIVLIPGNRAPGCRLSALAIRKCPAVRYGRQLISGSAGELATATHATHGAHAGTHAGTAHRGVHLSGPVRHGNYVRRSPPRNPVEERTTPVGHLIRQCGSGVIRAGQVWCRCGVVLQGRNAEMRQPHVPQQPHEPRRETVCFSQLYFACRTSAVQFPRTTTRKERVISSATSRQREEDLTVITLPFDLNGLRAMLVRRSRPLLSFTSYTS